MNIIDFAKFIGIDPKTIDQKLETKLLIPSPLPVKPIAIYDTALDDFLDMVRIHNSPRVDKNLHHFRCYCDEDNNPSSIALRIGALCVTLHATDRRSNKAQVNIIWSTSQDFDSVEYTAQRTLLMQLLGESALTCIEAYVASFQKM